MSKNFLLCHNRYSEQDLTVICVAAIIILRGEAVKEEITVLNV